MRMLLYGQLVSQSLVSVAELGIAELLGAGPLPVPTVAARLGTHEAATGRLLGALAAFGVFEAVGDDSYGLTPFGAALCFDTPGTAGPTALLLGRSVGRAWAEFTSAIRTGKSAFAGTYGAEFFDHLAEDEDVHAVFHESQSAAVVAELAGLAEHVGSKYRRLVDVGGGDGTVLCSILRQAENATGIVFDAPAVVPRAAARISRERLSSRCAAAGGDFFEQVPPGGDLYLLSRVVHDWGDDAVTRILSTCRAAMGRGTRLMIVDYVLDDHAGHMAAIMDLYMMSLFGADGGRERTMTEFSALLAGSGLQLTSHSILSSGMAILEAGRCDDDTTLPPGP
ncbi:methyltransferase [Amycolatopsis sp. NPDC059090]|uniref:methyltransferase n=1 Tax=Amycolatopsis sp. NPDC059090 TaxID=3346723 RepID=UPI00366DDFDB